MCGIIGSVNYQGTIDSEVIKSIYHRGPDHQGSYFNKINGNNIFLGNARLSIIDLSEKANQPLENEEFVIVFNGEIYNYKDIATELRSAGCSLKTQCDTEVVLEAWTNWGIESLKKLRGMFAFAILNKKNGNCYLIRDHFGIKPLFYSIDQSHGLSFCSELKGLKKISRNRFEINDKAIMASLMYCWIPENECIFKNVKKLLPGTLLKFSNNGSIEIITYWNLKKETNINPNANFELVQKTIEDSVKAHLVSDVPVSSLLSGGLDSSLITVLAAKQLGSIDSYTIKFKERDNRFEQMPEDIIYARKLANKFNLRLNEIEINPSIVDCIPNIMNVLDEPLGDPAAINTQIICEQLKNQGMKVLLSGMGADEIFGGYRRHIACLLAKKYRKTPLLVRNLLSFFINKFPVASNKKGYRFNRWLKRFIQIANHDEALAYYRSFTYYEKDELDKLSNRNFTHSINALYEEYLNIFNKAKHLDSVNRMLFVDMNMFLPSLNLAYTDRSSMSSSVEVRVPFIDKEVVNTAFSITGNKKISLNSGKQILKTAAEKILPKEFIYRPKSNFSAPLRSWVKNELKDMISDTLLPGILVKNGYINKEHLLKIIENDKKGIEDNSQKIWQLLNLEVWLKNNSTGK